MAVKSAVEEPAPSPVSGLHVYQAISAITAAMGQEGIPKSRESTGTGPKFKFRGIDAVYAALNPLLSQHNLVILPRVISREITERKAASGNALFYTVLRVEYDFVSAQDGSRHTVCTIGEAMDSGDKSASKAMSISFKYAAFLTFCIPVEGDDDPDATTYDVAAKDKPESKTETKQQAAAGPTKAEADAEYKRADALLIACTTMEAVKDVWEKQIDWTKIPKQWHDAMKKLRVTTEAEIKKSPPASSAPASASPPFDGDDIPF